MHLKLELHPLLVVGNVTPPFPAVNVTPKGGVASVPLERSLQHIRFSATIMDLRVTLYVFFLSATEILGGDGE